MTQRRIKRVGFVCLIVIASAAPGWPQQAPPALLLQPDDAAGSVRLDLTLGLRELEALALENNPTIQQALANVEKLRGIRTQVGLKPNPFGGYQAAEVGNGAHAGQQGVFFGREFVTAGKLKLNRRIVDQQIQSATWNWQAQELRVRSAVRLRYYEMLGTQRVFELAVELQRIADKALETSQKLLDAKEIARKELVPVKIEARRSRLTVLNADNQRHAAWRRLTAVVGDDSLQPVTLEGSIDDAPQLLEWEQVWNRLIAESPQIQAAYNRIEAARWIIRRARVEPIPNVETQFSIQYDADTNYTVAGIQIGVTFPVFNKNQGNIRAGHAELIRASHEVRRIELSLKDRLAGAFLQYENARQQVREYEQGILPLARENLKLTTESFTEGQEPYLQLLNAQRTYFQAVLAAVTAKTALWRSAIRIEGLLLTDGLSAPESSDDSVPSGGGSAMTPFGLPPFVQP